MNRTFETENTRKDDLFNAWTDYLTELQTRPELQSFEEVFEGLAMVSGLSKIELIFGWKMEEKSAIFLFPQSQPTQLQDG